MRRQTCPGVGTLFRDIASGKKDEEKRAKELWPAIRRCKAANDDGEAILHCAQIGAA